MTTANTALDLASKSFLGMTPVELESIHKFNLDQVSVSQLLGRDYVFIDIRNNPSILSQEKGLVSFIEVMIGQLSLSKSRTLFITIDNSPSGEPEFIKHDIAWHQKSSLNIESVSIESREQIDFMNMIWQCSTPFSPLA